MCCLVFIGGIASSTHACREHAATASVAQAGMYAQGCTHACMHACKQNSHPVRDSHSMRI